MSINHQLKKIFFALFFSVPVLALFSMTFFGIRNKNPAPWNAELWNRRFIHL